MTDPYDVIYMLKPVREVEPGWWKLRWRPIWRHTFSAYKSGYRNWWDWGWRTYRVDARNGWNRSWRHFCADVILAGHRLSFWIKWGFVVHEDGPSDQKSPRPLDIRREG